MRLIIAVLAAGALLIGSAALPAAATAADAAYAVSTDAQQPPNLEVEIDTDRDRAGAWYTNPLWIAIGVIAIVLLIVLIVMASRGGGTTIVRD